MAVDAECGKFESLFSSKFLLFNMLVNFEGGSLTDVDLLQVTCSIFKPRFSSSSQVHPVPFYGWYR